MTERTAIDPNSIIIESFESADGSAIQITIPGTAELRMSPDQCLALSGRLAAGAVIAQFGLHTRITPSLADGAIVGRILAPVFEDLLRPFLTAADDGDPAEKKKPDGG